MTTPIDASPARVARLEGWLNAWRAWAKRLLAQHACDVPAAREGCDPSNHGSDIGMRSHLLRLVEAKAWPHVAPASDETLLALAESGRARVTPVEADAGPTPAPEMLRLAELRAVADAAYAQGHARASACGEVGPGGQVCVKPSGHGRSHSDGSTLAAPGLSDETLCAEYYRVAGEAADPCVDVGGLRAVASAAIRDDWENPESESPWLAMAARNATERNLWRKRAVAWKKLARRFHGLVFVSWTTDVRNLTNRVNEQKERAEKAEALVERVAQALGVAEGLRCEPGGYDLVRRALAVEGARANAEREVEKLRGELAITQGWLDRFQGDAAANGLKAWRLEQGTRALVSTLPKCDGLNAPGVTEECDRPATNAFERGGGRWCDEHRPRDQGGSPADDYPRAPALRALVALLAAPEPTEGVGLPALALKAVRLWHANKVGTADAFAESMRALAAALDSPSGKEGTDG